MSKRRSTTFTRVMVTLAGLFVILVGGFTLPRLLNGQVVAGENAAIAALINISESEGAYRERYPGVGYAPELAALSVARTKKCDPSPEQACMVEYGLARNNGAPFRGYYFSDTSSPDVPHTSYMIVAVPVDRGRTGVRAFCVVERGVPRYKDLGRNARPQEITREQCLRDFTPLP